MLSRKAVSSPTDRDPKSGGPSVLSQKFAAQKMSGSAPYFVGNPRQVSNLAAVSFASGTDPATFASLMPKTNIT